MLKKIQGILFVVVMAYQQTKFTNTILKIKN